MNKVYKTVFNKSTQTWMAVCEYARRVGCGSASGGSKSVTRGVAGLLTFLSFAVLMALQSAHANTPTTIIADKSADKALQPIVLNTASGVVSVNIATPNARGLSNNHYSQFDVGSTGLVLNNNRKAVNTQIAGFVAANPYMARGEASTILNQVNSNNPSHLSGFIEVAGKKADVIIANPSGLVVNGAGFINAGNVHLAAANSQVNQGQVTGYEVGTGHIAAHGKLNLQGTDYAALIAKTAQINDEIYAGIQLDVILGENSVSLQDGDLIQLTAINKQTSTPSANQTANKEQQGVALDISSLGGMYAGKIHLIGTDKGFGVNNAGVITATGKGVQAGFGTLTLDAQGNLINAGILSAKDKLAVNTHNHSVQNDGTLLSEQADITINTKDLESTGTIHSTQTTTIDATDILNNQGSIYGGVLQLTTGKLDNTGKLVQTGTGGLNIGTDTLTNSNKAVIGQSLYEQTTLDAPSTPSSAQSAGTIGNDSKDNTTANTGNSSNTGTPATKDTTKSIPVPSADGFIIAKSLTNTNEQALITATGDIGISANQTSNTKQASIDAQTLNTNALANTDSKIALDDINWQLTRFDNSKGSITARDGMVIDSGSAIINTGGSLTSSGDMTLIAKDSIVNQDGTITAVKQADIAAKELQNGGTITADTLTITQLADYTHTDQDKLVANRLAFTTSGKLSNQSQLTANQDLTLNTKHIDNTQAGIISSGNHTQIISQTNITNQGLINSENTLIKAVGIIDNLAGGRMYGTQLAIQADTLNNTPAKATNQQTNQENDHHTSPVIAARQRLDIGVNTLNNNPNPDRAGKFNEDFDNQALITSLGSLHIGGSLDDNHHATGKADTVVNKGATIESGGQMQINTAVLKNENADWSTWTEETLIQKNKKIYFAQPGSTIYEEHEVHFTNADEASNAIVLLSDGSKMAGGDGEDWYYAIFDQYHLTDHVKTSDPARMVSGQDMLIYGDQLTTGHSQMAAGKNFSIKGDTVKNVSTPGYQFEHTKNENQLGESEDGLYYHYVEYVGTLKNRKGNKYNYLGNYLPPDNLIDTYQLPILNAAINTTPSSTKIDAPATDNNTSAIMDINNNDNTTIPTSSLYIINADDPNLPLVQTDPAFTDYKQWLSSDYMLKALQSDPNHIHKRLSDGYGEQERIKDQYYHLTGRHINTDYRSNEEAYKTLMDNGITAAKAFGYTLGTALTAEQMANLTTDIVWLVKQSITYTTKDKDGNSITKTIDALVPKLYLRSTNIATGTLTADGRYSTISARSVNMQLTGDLDNNGNIIAKDTAAITANNVNNTGTIYGNFVAVTADNTIANHGTLHANSAMSLDAGNQIINQSQTATQTNTQGQSHSSNTATTRIATISVGSGLKDQTDEQGKPLTTLSLRGNQIIYQGATSDNAGGNTQMSAENGIDIGTVTVSNHISAVADDNNYFKYSQTKDVGSNISSYGNTIIRTTGEYADINIQGSSVQSEGVTAVKATGDVRMGEGRQTQSVESESLHTNRRLTGSKTERSSFGHYSDKSLISQVGGDQVVIHGTNTTLMATEVLADKDILIKADNQLLIGSAKDNVSGHSSQEVTKKGLFATSPTSVTLGKQQTRQNDAYEQVTYTGSLVGTTGGNIRLEAGDDINIINSDIIAQKDETDANTGNILFKAQAVDITSQNIQTSNESHFLQKTTGVTAGVSSSVASDVQSIETLKDATQDTDSRRAKLMGTLAAASKVRTLAQNLQNGNLGSIRVQATAGSQSTKNQTLVHQEENDAANIHADNNLIINLKGKGKNSDLVVTGSNISVGNNLYQNVEGDVIYQASTQTSTTTSQNSSKGVGFGVYASANLSTDGLSSNSAGFTANANRAKGDSQETTITHTNTQVTVGGTTVNDIGGSLILDGANLDTTYLTGTVDGDLIVKSHQDEYQYTHDQKQAGFSADVGFNGKPQSFSINGGKTDIDASYQQVTHQSGIKAKESTLSVQGQGNFTGGYLITDQGKNQTQFAQGIQTQDIQNHLNYQGDAISVGIGIGANTSNPNGKAKPALQGLGYGTITPTHKTSTTHLAITDQAGLSHINTENFNQPEVQDELNQIIANDFDKEQAVKELNAQVTITQAFDAERRAIRSEYAKKAEDYRKEAKDLPDNDPRKTELETKAKQIDDNLRIFDGITSALYAPNSNGIIGDVARAASPELAYRIGQEFKRKDQEGSAQHLLAHAVLGAAVSAATGNDIATGTISAVSNEAGAKVLANYLYQGKDPKDLTQEQKDIIVSILNLATATTIYTATDGSAADAVSGTEIGKAGVEGNAYVPLSAMQGKTRAEVERLYESNISYFDANCVKSSANCNRIIEHMIKFADSDYVALNYPHLKDRTVRLLRDNPQAMERYFNNKVAQFNAKDRSILNMYLLPALEVAGGVAGVGGSVAGATYACAQTAGFGCYAAAVAGSAGFTSSVDHVVTGSSNIGKPLSQQDPTAFVKFLKSQGLSETTASNLQLAIDVFGTGGIGHAVRTGDKAGNSISAKTSRTKTVYDEPDNDYISRQYAKKVRDEQLHNFHSRLLGKGANVGDLSNISGKSLEDIVANVPKDAKIRILTPQFKGAKRGLEYTWRGVDGKKHTLRIHDADPNAPINSNARKGWVARWQVGQQYYDPVNRNLAHRQAHNKRSPNYDPTVSNNTHIPIKQPTREQMDFMRYLEE